MQVSICYSDKEEHDGHLKLLNDALIRTENDAQLISSNCQFQCATAENHHVLLRGWTNRVPFVVQYFPGVEKLRHALHSLQHINDDNEHLTKILPTAPLFAFKQPPNLNQTIVCSKLPSLQDNIDHETTQPCHGNLCMTYQIIDMDTTMTHGSTIHHMHGRYSCDLANVVYLICCKDALRHGTLWRPCRCYDNGSFDAMQQPPDRNVPSQWGNTSAVKDI
eukprot:g33569.t1